MYNIYNIIYIYNYSTGKSLVINHKHKLSQLLISSSNFKGTFIKKHVEYFAARIILLNVAGWCIYICFCCNI